MGSTLTFDEILDLPKKILNVSLEYDAYSDLLSEDMILMYYYKDLKSDLNVYFDRFKAIKYSYHFASDYCPIPTPTPSFYHSSGFQKTDPVGKYVTAKIDDSIWLKQFYSHILNLASKLTLSEATYLVDTFFAHRSEESISEEIGVCRATLQKIKRSCLVKAYLEFRSMDFSS